MFVSEIGEELLYGVRLENGEAKAVAVIGHDNLAKYGVFVALSPIVGCPLDELELVFCLTRTEGSRIEELWDGAATSEFIPDREDRDIILSLILNMVEAVVMTAQPRKVMMTTYSANLPEKALRKYHLAAKVFTQLGYKSGRGDPYHGLNVWMMELLD